MSAITELKELEHTRDNLGTSKDYSHRHRVSDDQGLELTFDVPSNDLEKFSSKTELLTQSHRFEVAKSAEIQSWLQYHHRDIMMMRWVL